MSFAENTNERKTMQRKKKPVKKQKKRPSNKTRRSNQPANRKKWADKTFEELDLSPSDY
jgi:hypothetical protein